MEEVRMRKSFIRKLRTTMAMDGTILKNTLLTQQKVQHTTKKETERMSATVENENRENQPTK